MAEQVEQTEQTGQTVQTGQAVQAWQMHPDVKETLFTEQQIKQRVAEMGAAITQKYSAPEYAGQPIVLISVLRGAAIFMADLAREIQLPLEMDYIAVSSYGNAAKTSGVVQLVKDLSSEIEGKHIIVCEDILDSGLTLSYLINTLAQRGPASITVVTLVRKLVEPQADIKCDHIGFECPNEFIVGYGLDYSQRYRNLPYIGILKPEVYS